MNAIETYLLELDRALLTRGRARRRVLAECRDHLDDAAQVRGADEAVRRFGPVSELAAQFDAETAARRGSRATVATLVGVCAVGGSTLALVNAAGAGTAVALWAVVFFGAAQSSAASTLLAGLQVAALRRSRATPAELGLLGRRNLSALGLALLTEFSAAAAVPGHAGITELLAGPALALVVLVPVARAWVLARRLERRLDRLDRLGADAVPQPLAEIGTLLGPRCDGVGPTPLLVAASAVMVSLAFAWSDLDRGTVAGSCAAAAVESALLLVGFLLLGRALGLRTARTVAR